MLHVPVKEVLDEIIDTCKLHKLDKGLTRPLLLLLLYDLLFGSQRIEGGGHYKRLLLQHKTPIQSTLARIYIKRQASSPIQLLPLALRPRPPHPRYVRINTVLCSRQQAIEALQADGWVEVDRPSQHPTATDLFLFASSRSFYRDMDIDGLLVFPPSTAFHSSPLYEKGWMVLQDKASCMSAACLNPTVDDVVVDGCAAPGNKTSHLVAIIGDKAKQSNNSTQRGNGTVDAFEVHQSRFTLLTRMLEQKGVHVNVDCPTRCHPHQTAVKAGSGVSVTAHHASFLSLKGDDGLGRRVTAVLLDPTCSGSGMTHTLDAYYKEKNREAEQELKAKETGNRKTQQLTGSQAGKKRRRTESNGRQQKEAAVTAEVEVGSSDVEAEEQQSGGASESLLALSAFQTSLLVHSFTLPALTHIVYSTCSHHTEENEAVIAAALQHSGREKGWEVEAGLLPHWKRRGRQSAVAGLSEAECERMVRCDADDDCMNGFFVCGLVKRSGGRLAESETKSSVAAVQNDTRTDGDVVNVGERGGVVESSILVASNQHTKKPKKKKKKRKVGSVPAS